MKDISGKHITILGAVRSGLAAAKLAKKLGAIPFVSDYSNADALGDNLSSLDKHAIKYETGGHTDKVFDCDFIVTSPGVPSNSDVLLKAKEKNIKVVSELEFASWFNKGTVIAITGTNGKTTTTSLCAHLLNSCGLKTHLAGNIGVAFSDIVLNVKEDEFVALEVSSFQLDFIETFKPKFALLLNLTKDHLDRYDDNFENYIKSKFNIIMNQNSKDYFIINCDDEIIANFPVRSYNNYCFSMGQAHSDGCFIEEGRFYFRMNHEITEIGGVENLSIKGEHNQYNALAVLTVAKLLNLDNQQILDSFKSFPGVEHRLELVRTINGVEYINDSKATNVDSVWYALRSFDNPIILILGGKDKGNDYSRLKDLVVNHVKKIYAIGSSADKIFEFFKDHVKVEIVDSLELTVQKSINDAIEGDVVLLSPACASFDMFENYEHRGKIFKEAVVNLSE